MPHQIVRASPQDRTLLQNLVNLYLHEVSAFAEIEMDGDGQFIYPGLACFWIDPEKQVYIVKVKEKCAGFVLVKDIESLRGHAIHTVPDFFLVNAYRGLGIGEEIARMVFDRHQGLWQIAVPEDNRVARAFWKAVIWRYSGGKQLEFRRTDWNGPVFEFSSPGVRPLMTEVPRVE